MRSISQRYSCPLVLTALLSISACSPALHIKQRGTLPPKGASFVVAKPTFLYELNKTPESSMFQQGNAVGYLRHHGGYVQQSDADGFVRSKHVEVLERNKVRRDLSRWATKAFAKALTTREYQYLGIEAGLALSPPMVVGDYATPSRQGTVTVQLAAPCRENVRIGGYGHS
jgi:hypothetical protein